MMLSACVSDSIGSRDCISARRRGAIGWPFSQGLLITILLIAPLIYLSGCGPGQTDVGQANGNSVPVSLNISMPQESAAASTRGNRFWATLQSWLPSVTNTWAQAQPPCITSLSAIHVNVTGPNLAPISTPKDIPPNTPCRSPFTIDLDVPVGPDRIFTVFGVDATKRTIRRGNSRPFMLTVGQPVRVDIVLTEPRADSLTGARADHTATLLQNGQVLVVGGSGANSVLASAEQFDPGTNRWTPLAIGLNTARSNHTATLLQNGQVLVVGGRGVRDLLASVELFDPAANNWTTLLSLSHARVEHTATLLQNGQVLVVGGRGVRDLLASVELFDPATNNWTTLPSLSQAREEHTATRLENGQVLIVGGQCSPSSCGTLDSAELFDPNTKAWTTLARLTDARLDHTATRLENGQVLVVGGNVVNGPVLDSAELFDPKMNQWTTLARLTKAREEHTATLLQNKQVLVVGGGSVRGDSGPVLDSAELFDPKMNQWTTLATGLTDAREDHTATCLKNGQVLIVGGRDVQGDGVLVSAELFDLSSPCSE